MAPRSRKKQKFIKLNGIEQGISLLPALTLEALLAHEERRWNANDAISSDWPIKAHQLFVDGDGRAHLANQAFQRLFPCRPLTDTDVFQDNLRLPPLKSARGPRNESPRRQPTSSRATSASSSSRAQIQRADKEWHVMLLQSTYEGNAPSEEYVAGCLCSMLGLDIDAARRLAFEAVSSRPVVLKAFASQSQAIAAAQQLRDKGLGIRVTSNPHKDGSPQARGNRIENFAHFCNGTLQGDLLRLADAVKGRQQPNDRESLPAPSWRQEMDAKLPVVPEDAVQAYFESTQEARSSVCRASQTSPEFDDAVADPELDDAVADVISTDASMQRRRSSITDKGSSDSVAGQPQQQHKRREHSEDVSRRRHSSGGRSSTDAVDFDCGIGEDAKGVLRAQSSKFNIMDNVPQHQIRAIKENCRLARMFVFGHVMGRQMWVIDNEGDEVLTEALQESIGDKSQVYMLYYEWTKLDQDVSGRIDFKEFRAHSKALVKERQNDTKVAQDFEKLLKVLFQKKSSFQVDDLMKMIWPSTGPEQIRTMYKWFKSFHTETLNGKLTAPPPLPEAELEGLRSIYAQFDKDGDGQVSIDALLSSGVVQPYEREGFARQWIKDGDGVISLDEFCQMMCPAGYRATVFSQVGSLPDGRRVYFHQGEQQWRLQEDDDEHAGDDVLG